MAHSNSNHLVVHKDPKSVGSEAFRTLRTNLQFASPDKPLKTILMTSTGPGEGKSTVMANLAIAFAQSGQNTLLVDCDLRRSNVHRIFGMHNGLGLTSHLVGEAGIEQVMMDPGLPNLTVIPAGPIPPNPSEILGSNAMKEFVAKVKSQYDMVLLDAPPVVAVTDAQILSPLADGVLLTVAAGETPKELALQAKSLLQQAQANILGVVLNRLNPEDQKEYQYYYYYYGESAGARDD